MYRFRNLRLTQLLLIVLFSCSFLSAQSLEERKMIANANALYAQDKWDEARAMYQRILSESPSSAKANYNLGNTFYQMKEFDKAATHFSKAAKLSNDKTVKAQTYHNLGNSLMKEKKYKAAIEAYKDALRNNPKDNQTRYNLSLAKKLLNQDQQNPNDLPKPSDFAKKMKKTADSLAQEGKFELAQKVMRGALQKDSTVMHFQTFINKIEEIIILDTIQ